MSYRIGKSIRNIETVAKIPVLSTSKNEILELLYPCHTVPRVLAVYTDIRIDSSIEEIEENLKIIYIKEIEREICCTSIRPALTQIK